MIIYPSKTIICYGTYSRTGTKHLRDLSMNWGIGAEVIKEYGLIQIIRPLKEKACQELVKSGFTTGGRWIARCDFDIPSLKETGYGLVVAQKIPR